jgi:hypothetical protein
MPGANNADVPCQHITLPSQAASSGRGAEWAHSLFSRQTRICSFVVLLVHHDVLEVLGVWVTVHGRPVHQNPLHE